MNLDENISKEKIHRPFLEEQISCLEENEKLLNQKIKNLEKEYNEIKKKIQ